MLIDALVLAGGRSSRLDSVPKSELVILGRSLLERALSAVGSAHTIVIVGPRPCGSLRTNTIVTREDPPFGGPAAAIAAGVDALLASGDTPSRYVIVIACDMPGIGSALDALIDALESSDSTGGVPSSDGVIAVDDGHQRQPLAAIYDTRALAMALTRHRRAGSLGGLSAFRLIHGLHLTEVMIPAHATDDIDTWADAERFGAARPRPMAEEKTR